MATIEEFVETTKQKLLSEITKPPMIRKDNKGYTVYNLKTKTIRCEIIDNKNRTVIRMKPPNC